jgi:hypothetical protein
VPAQSTQMDNRAEFRHVLRLVVGCLRTELDVPGVSPFEAEELRDWFHRITVEDVRAVWGDDDPPEKE